MVHAALGGKKCSECHTVHNSQDGQSVTYQLNASSTSFESTLNPNEMLLVERKFGRKVSP